jgi:hypothetical protein
MNPKPDSHVQVKRRQPHVRRPRKSNLADIFRLRTQHCRQKVRLGVTTLALERNEYTSWLETSVKVKVKFSHYRPEQALGDPEG